MSYFIRVSVVILSLLFFIFEMILCFVPIFRLNGAGIKAEQNIWYQLIKQTDGNIKFYVRESDCSTYNTAFQLMEGAVVGSLGLSFIAIIFAFMQLFLHHSNKGLGCQIPIIITYILLLICAIVNLVVVVEAWSKGFCMKDASGITTVTSFKSNGWRRVEGFAVVCLNFIISVGVIVAQFFA